MQIVWHPSPNFGPRRDVARPDLIVLHYTAMQSCTRARDWLCTPEAQVSAHYIVSEQGHITQMVQETMRAWHAGAGGWQGSTDVNSRSIGIELANTGTHPFSEPQMMALEALMPQIMARHVIGPQGVIAHSDCAPGRKIDPGARFDWARLARRNLALMPLDPHPAPPDPAQFHTLLAQIGYPEDVPPDTRLAAFRLRFAPLLTGPLSELDMGVAADIALQMGKISPPEA